MIKNVKWFFVVLISCSLISFSVVEKSIPTERLAIGDKAPSLEFRSEKQTLNLLNANGNYTLLSFWASYDAESRTANAQFGYIAAQHPKLKMVSVSFDEMKSVFDATVKQDHLDKQSCFRVADGDKSVIFREYGLKNGFKNYLLDSKGVIIARNITPDALADYVK